MTPDYSTPSTPQLAPAGGRDVVGRLGRLVLKELREILRDRRTIITLVVMPILVYPLLALVFQRFLFPSLKIEGRTEFVIVVESDVAQLLLERRLALGDMALDRQRRTELSP